MRPTGQTGRPLTAALLLAACAAAPEPPVPGAPEPATFEDFVGDWRGSMQIAGGRTVAMSLEVAPVSGDPQRFHWRLQYEGQPVRDYTLVVRDRARGEAAVDEHNGIVLPTLLRGRELVSVFEVQGSVIDVRYRLEPAGLVFALESYRPAAAEPAGEGVRAWPQLAVQRGLLTRR